MVRQAAVVLFVAFACAGCYRETIRHNARWHSTPEQTAAPDEVGAPKAAALPTEIPAAFQPEMVLRNPPRAPERFEVEFLTTVGKFTVRAERAWAPHGVDRFFALVRAGFYEDIAFFRVMDDFMAQFGVCGDPAKTAQMRVARIQDDPVKQSNVRGMITFAKTKAPNSRATQLFVNFVDNSWLDEMGFAPIAKITKGIEVIDKIYRVGECAPKGPGPSQRRVKAEGNAFLKKEFPKLDYILSARFVR